MAINPVPEKRSLQEEKGAGEIKTQEMCKGIS